MKKLIFREIPSRELPITETQPFVLENRKSEAKISLCQLRVNFLQHFLTILYKEYFHSVSIEHELFLKELPEVYQQFLWDEEDEEKYTMLDQRVRWSTYGRYIRIASLLMSVAITTAKQPPFGVKI